MLITRFIRAPRPDTIDMLLRRIPTDAKAKLDELTFDAIGLVQCDLSSMFYLADVGQKAANVMAVEIAGYCPQHIGMVAFFGDTAAVGAALAEVTRKVKE